MRSFAKKLRQVIFSEIFADNLLVTLPSRVNPNQILKQSRKNQALNFEKENVNGSK